MILPKYLNVLCCPDPTLRDIGRLLRNQAPQPDAVRHIDLKRLQIPVVHTDDARTTYCCPAGLCLVMCLDQRIHPK